MQQREGQPVPETPEQTVERFIGFTKKVLSDSSPDVDMFWEVEMLKLYGSEELVRVTKDKAYMGVKGVKEDLGTAFSAGGLASLKVRFLVTALENTQIGKLTEPFVTAFERIMLFK